MSDSGKGFSAVRLMVMLLLLKSGGRRNVLVVLLSKNHDCFATDGRSAQELSPLAGALLAAL